MAHETEGDGGESVVWACKDGLGVIDFTGCHVGCCVFLDDTATRFFSVLEEQYLYTGFPDLFIELVLCFDERSLHRDVGLSQSSLYEYCKPHKLRNG